MDPKEKFIQDFVTQGRQRGLTDEDIKKRLEPALLELDQRLQAQPEATSQPVAQPQGEGFVKELGRELVRPLQAGTKTASMVGNSIQTFLTPEYHRLLKKAEGGEILSDAEISKLNEYADSFAGRPVGMGESNVSKNWFEFSDEDMKNKFTGKNAVDRFGNTLEHSMKMSAGIGANFVPLGAGGKAVTTIAKTGIEKLVPGAIARILQVGGKSAVSGLLNEVSKDDVTAQGMATSGLASFIFGAGGRTLGEVGNKAGGSLSNNVPKLFMKGYAKPPTGRLQMKETEEVLKYGKKMLSEQIIENGELTRSPTKLWSVADGKLKEVGEEISKVIDNSNGTMKASDLYTRLDEEVMAMDEMFKNLPTKQQEALGSIIDRDLSTALKSLKEDLSAFEVNGEISYKHINLIKGKIDKSLYKAYDLAKKGTELTPADSLRMDLADVLRDSLNSNVKGLKPLNQKYGYYKAVQRATLPIISKGMHSAPLGDTLIVGMGGMTGLTAGGVLGPVGAIAGGAAGTLIGSGMAKVMRSPTTWFTAALIANKAGKATSNLSTKAMDNKLLEFMGRKTINTITGAQ